MDDFISPQEMLGQTPEMIDVARKRRMAKMLLQQSQMPEGKMVSGHYVAPAWTQMLASGLTRYMGEKGLDEADEQAKQIAQGLQQKREAWMGEMPRATPNTSEVGPTIPQQPGAEDYTAWALRGMQVDPRAAAMGMQSANMAMNREAQAAARAQQEQIRRDQMAQRAQQAEQQRALQLQIAQMRQQQGQNPYYQFIGTPEGIAVGNARTGQLSIGNVAGRPIMKASDDPNLQGRIAGSKAGAQVMGKETAEAQLALPTQIAKAEEAVQLVDELLKAPGFKQAVGLSRLTGVHKIPGTAAKDFDVRLDQIRGQQFLQAFETLKGGGQITEIEGKKATEAISRMNPEASEEEFTKAAREFQSIIRKGLERARQKAGAQGATGDFGTPQPTAPKRIRFDAQGNVIQ